MSAELKRIRNEFLMLLGAAVIVLLIVGAIVYGVYAVIGELTNEGRHILATGEFFTTIGAFVLGLRYAKSHVKGVERGLDLKLSARERAHQAARPAVAAGPVISPAARFDDVLPTVKRADIIVRADDSQSSIDI